MNLKQKLMSVAVAGALAAPALAYAQASTVQMYGRLNFLYGYYDNGAGRNKTDAMGDTESEIGVRGSENVGGGMSVHFQCHTSFDVVGIRAAAGTAGWCGRNSSIGLKGNFGDVFIGNWDTANKVMMGNYRVFALGYPMGLGNTVNNSASNVDNGAILAGATIAQSSFSRRQQKSVHYHSPVFSGFQAMGSFSAANEATQVSSAATITKPRMWAAAANYTNGPFGIGLGYERHEDYNPAVQGTYTGGTDYSWQAGARYTFMGKLRLNVQYVRLNYDLAAGRDMSLNNWNVNGQWDIAGPHFIRVGYVRVGDTKGSAGTTAAPIQVGEATANGGAGNSGAEKFVFEYGYNLSKRTELTLGYARTENDGFSNRPVGGNADSNTFGETQTYIGGRISHRF